MLEGKCPECGFYRIGWALGNPRHQTCPKCGTGLEIAEGGRTLFRGYSPFGAEGYFVIPPDSVPLSQDEDNNSQVQKQ